MTNTEIEITDENQDTQLPLLIGARIASVTRERSDPNQSFEQGANGITMILEDGRKIRFGSWGYDADGATMHITQNP